MAAQKKIDYERIEPGWRAGLLSPHQLAAKYTEETGQAVSHAAIIKHFRKLGIPRDLSEKIQAKAKSMVTEAMVTGKVTARPSKSDAAIVEDNAVIVASVQLSHRRDIQRSRSITMRLLEELELQSGRENAELLEQLGELMRREDDRGQDKLNDLYQKIISLPGRAKTMKDLGESLRVLVTLERQAFGLDNAGPDGEAQGGPTKQLTDAERAVRLSRLMSGNPDVLAVILQKLGGGNGA